MLWALPSFRTTFPEHKQVTTECSRVKINAYDNVENGRNTNIHIKAKEYFTSCMYARARTHMHTHTHIHTRAHTCTYANACARTHKKRNNSAGLTKLSIQPWNHNTRVLKKAPIQMRIGLKENSPYKSPVIWCTLLKAKRDFKKMHADFSLLICHCFWWKWFAINQSVQCQTYCSHWNSYLFLTKEDYSLWYN